jgi:hypothetical protein
VSPALEREDYMIINIAKLAKDHRKFLKQINNLSLVQAEKLRDSGKITGSNFDSLCNYIGKKGAAKKGLTWKISSTK